MKLKIALSLLIAIFFRLSSAQVITVVDEATNRAIADVFVYHENKTHVAYTNEKGVTDLSAFPSGLIFIQHPSYYEKSIAYLGSELSVSMSEKIVSFSEVVISANKWEQEKENVSQQILSINRRTIEFQNPQTTADLLASSGEVYVQKSQLGGGSPKLRGFAANSVLLVVDGVRMNNAIFRSGNLQNVINIDANALASSEVIFGPGSVIYGSDALGGVMDFHTIDPNWSSDGQAHISGNFLGRYSSAANERTGHVDLAVSKEKFTFFHSTSFTAFDDLRAGARRSKAYEGAFERTFYASRIDGQDRLVANDDVNVQRFSGYNLFNTVNKAKVRLGTSADLQYGFYFSTTSDIPRYDNLTETIGTTDSLEAAEWYYGPQKWQMHNLRLNYYQPTSLFDQAKVTLAYQKFDESRNDRDFGDDRLRVREEQVDMISASLDFEKELPNANLYYGLDFFHNDVSSSAFRRNLETGVISEASTRYPDGGSKFTSVAGYGSWVHQLSEKFTLNTGVRFNAISLSASTSDSIAALNNAADISIDNASINGAVGLAWFPMDKFKVSYNLSTGFRSPNVDDVGKLFEVGESVIVPNPDLTFEYSVSNEIAIEHTSEGSQIRFVAFYSKLFDAIVDRPFTLGGQSEVDGLPVFAKVNADEAQIYGASLSLQAELSERFAVENVVAITDGRDVTNDEPLRHTTPIFGRGTLIFKQKKFRSEFYIEYNGDRRRADIPSSEIDRKPYLYTADGSPGWYTFNLKSSYQFNEFLNANIGVENILDQHYRPYTSGISAPGRNFIVAVRASI